MPDGLLIIIKSLFSYFISKYLFNDFSSVDLNSGIVIVILSFFSIFVDGLIKLLLIFLFENE